MSAFHFSFYRIKVLFLLVDKNGVKHGEQQKSFQTGLLKDEHKEKLNGIGVLWSPSEEKWEFRFQHLLKYKETKGNCNMPKIFSPNIQLGSWVNTQQ